MIVIGITIIIPICMLVVGSVYFYDCPAENYIPVYLIVGGCIRFVYCCLTMITNYVVPHFTQVPVAY